MTQNQRQVSDTELVILNVLWRREKATIREISEDIYSQANSTEYATVQSLLKRLDKKGFVQCDRSGHVHKFFAIRGREEFIDLQLTNMAEKVCDGSYIPLLMNLAEKTQLSNQQREQLEKLINES